MDRRFLLIVVNLLLFSSTLFVLGLKDKSKPTFKVETPLSPPVVVAEKPVSPSIIKPIPGYQNYDLLLKQLVHWKEQSPGLTELEPYGSSSEGQNLYYFRVTNLKDASEKPKVLITACIHGNEPLSASVVMAYIGNLLNGYGKDASITNLLNTRDVYFIPVVSPDSYPITRFVDGVDPNRDFPTARDEKKVSIKPIAALQAFFLKTKFNAVISCHTWGRAYLIPWGDRMDLSPNHNDYVHVVGEMGRLSNYKMMRCCELYQGNGGMNIDPIRYGEKDWSWKTLLNSVPISGGELDWFYRHGSFSIVMEMGTHQRLPHMNEVKEEFDRTFSAVKFFIQEAPLVSINKL